MKRALKIEEVAGTKGCEHGFSVALPARTFVFAVEDAALRSKSVFFFFFLVFVLCLLFVLFLLFSFVFCSLVCTFLLMFLSQVVGCSARGSKVRKAAGRGAGRRVGRKSRVSSARARHHQRVGRSAGSPSIFLML
jgi:polyferredoxin